MDGLAKLLVAAGVGLVLLGLAVAAGARLGLGRLPGDLRWETDNVTVYAPIATCVVVSIVGTVLVNLLTRR